MKKKKKTKLKSIRLEMVFSISLLSIILCAVFYAASMTLSKTAITNVMEDSLKGITHQSSSLISERVNGYYDKLGAVATNDLFWSTHISESRLFSLLKSVQTDEGYLDLVYVNNTGTAYDASGKSYPIGDNESYHLGMIGNNSVSDPTPTGDGDKVTMTYTVPVFNLAGGVSGVLMMTTNGYELTDLISDITFAKTGYAYIINKEGVMVAHPDKTMVLTQDRTLEKAKADPEQQGLAVIMERMIARESGMGGYTYKGVTKYAGYAPIKGTDWFMALTAPDSEVFEKVYQLQWILLAAAVLLSLLSAGVAFVIANRIVRPIRPMVQAAEKFAVGDLDVDVNVRQNNEIGLLGRAFHTVSVNMSQLIASIRSASEQVAVGSRQIASSGMNLAQGATQQASALEELSASVEQLASQTRLNAKSASEANELATNTRELAERGNEKMADMLKAMEDIDQSSANIHRIIKVIDDIAFQTNILALNAAVEAARAGQHGRGFAVVAEEVRNLAAKSASAAKETSNLIEGSSKSVAGGARLARETADALKEIMNEINRVTTLVHGISVSSGEQSTGIEQINQVLLQISQVVQANSSTSQESAAASRELTAQADTLLTQVAGFRLKGEGSVQEQSESAVTNQKPDNTNLLEGKAAPEKVAAPAKAVKPVPVKADKAEQRPPKASEPLPTRAAAAAKPAPARPRISLGEDDLAPTARPTRISLGDEDEISSARSSRITLSDNEFGKY